VDEVPPVSGDFYQLYFTSVINTSDESRHHGAVVEQALIAAIDGAQSTIDGALFELNAPDTTAALVRALGRGVQVRLVMDNEHALEDPESTAEEIIAAGAQTRSDERSALMHSKFLIFDGRAVWTGSMNITRNGMYNNNNNAMLIQSEQLVANYQAEFEEMFIDGFFARRGDPRPVAARTINIGDTTIETYFSPEDGEAIENRIAELARGAQSSIRVMSFSFTLDSIGAAMIEAHNRGVTVQGVFETTGSLQGQMRPLACAGAEMRQDGNPDILHHKVFIFDEQIVVMGSFNFSASARDNNTENLLIIHNPVIAAAYTAEWQARFNEGRAPSASDLAC
jgi:phosphatidylserine/phosphatidylglycerophosphate/cardiolipin synthase-like enzyme